MPSRPMPLIGFLCLMAGAGVLYSSRRFAMHFEDWGPSVRNAMGLIGLGLILFGAKLVTSGFQGRTRSRIGRLNRNRVMLPREGMVYLVIMIVTFVASLIGNNNLLMLVFSMMAGPFILNGGIAFTLLKRTRVSRRLPDRAMAGELISVDIQFENRKWWFSVWVMLVRDAVFRLDRANHEQLVVEPSVLFANIRAGQSRTACYQLRLNQRGRYRFGPLEVSTRFPLGLVERGYITDFPGELLVYPKLGQLTSRWHAESRMASEPVQQMQSRRGMFEDEFHHLRDYRPGDNPRSIHWRTSARQQGLMVREFHQTRDRSLVVIIELWQPDQPSAADRDRVELAVCFAATVCVEHLRQTRQADQHVFVSGRKEEHLRGQSGLASAAPLLEALAVVEAGQARRIGGQIETAAQYVSSMTRTVVITTVPDGNTRQLPLELLPGAEVFRAIPSELNQWFVLE